jgi:hypothetical protein
VDTIRDRLSKKNPRLCAFNTLSGAFEAYWGDCNPDEEDAFKAAVDFVVLFWNRLATVRPELAKLDIARRKRVRETLLVDSALAISAYVAIARKMQDRQIDLSLLERLGKPVTATFKVADGTQRREVDLFSRENPIWEQIGVLVPSQQKSGQNVFTLRNARQTRAAMLKTLEDVLGLEVQPSLQPALEAIAERVG